MDDDTSPRFFFSGSFASCLGFLAGRWSGERLFDGGIGRDGGLVLGGLCRGEVPLENIFVEI